MYFKRNAMIRHRFMIGLVLTLTFVFFSITVSAKQPRAVPSNDNIAGAIAIKIGKNYTVPDIEGATNEINEPVASCRTNSAIPHSVWFKINVPIASTFSLSTFGTLLARTDSHSMDTVVAIHEQTGPGTYVERACNDDLNGNHANLVFSAVANTTYYVTIGTYSSSPLLPESTLKLTTRMLSTAIFLPDQGFEGTLAGDNWTLKNGADDMIVCGNPTYNAHNGSCAFRFTGTPGAITKLSRTLTFPAYFKPRKNAVIAASFMTRVMDTAALSNTKVKLIVKYKDGTPQTVSKLNMNGTTEWDFYSSRSRYVFLASPKVASIKLLFKFGESSGTLMVDGFSYFYAADISTRGLLPVPPAAQ